MFAASLSPPTPKFPFLSLFLDLRTVDRSFSSILLLLFDYTRINFSLFVSRSSLDSEEALFVRYAQSSSRGGESRSRPSRRLASSRDVYTVLTVTCALNSKRGQNVVISVDDSIDEKSG